MRGCFPHRAFCDWPCCRPLACGRRLLRAGRSVDARAARLLRNHHVRPSLVRCIRAHTSARGSERGRALQAFRAKGFRAERWTRKADLGCQQGAVRALPCFSPEGLVAGTGPSSSTSSARCRCSRASPPRGPPRGSRSSSPRRRACDTVFGRAGRTHEPSIAGMYQATHALFATPWAPGPGGGQQNPHSEQSSPALWPTLRDCSASSMIYRGSSVGSRMRGQNRFPTLLETSTSSCVLVLGRGCADTSKSHMFLPREHPVVTGWIP